MIRFLSACIGSFNASKNCKALTSYIKPVNDIDVTCPMARQKITNEIVLRTRNLFNTDHHNIPQITFLGLKTLIGNVPFGLRQGRLSPDFGCKQGIPSFPEYISSVKLPGASLVGDILKLSNALSLDEPLNLSKYL